MTHPTDLIIKPTARPDVLEGVEFTETRNRSTPATPQGTTAVRVSAAVLFGALIAAGFGAHRNPDRTDLIAGAVLAAIFLFLGCLWRHEITGPDN